MSHFTSRSYHRRAAAYLSICFHKQTFTSERHDIVSKGPQKLGRKKDLIKGLRIYSPKLYMRGEYP